MLWAIERGGWNSHRLNAIDCNNKEQHLFSVPNLLKRGTRLPGIYRTDEVNPKRVTSRAELACLASWKQSLIQIREIRSPSGWHLLMEDDVGASLAAPEDWAHSLLELIDFCPNRTLAIQLAPISAFADSLQRSGISNGRYLAVAKEKIRSHGNGAVLLNQWALKLLIDPFLRLSSTYASHWHPLVHPWCIRPVADKWIYGSLPPGTCQVATYPHFCLEASSSTLHEDHINEFHKPSREITIEIWKEDQRNKLIQAQQTWENF